MWYSVILGYRLRHLLASRFRSDLDMGDSIVLGTVLVVGILAAQVPLWIAGQVFHWKLVAGEQAESEEKQQFNLRHLLLGMFLLSVVLGAGRLLLPVEEEWRLYMDDELWVVLSAVILCNLLITVPCIWGSFAPSSMMVPLAVGWILYCSALTGAELGILSLILGFPDDASDVFVGFLMMNLTQCATVFGSLLLLRVAGLRFVRRRSASA